MKSILTRVIVVTAVVGLIVLALSYDAPTHSEIRKDRVEKEASRLENIYTIVIIEKCEYIMYSNRVNYGGYGFMAHKGNCKNH